MAIWTLPNFNLQFDVWDTGNAPPAAPDVTNLPVQLYLQPKADTPVYPVLAAPAAWYVPPVILRVDPVPFIARGHVPWVDALLRFTDAVGADRYYLVYWWEWEHAGFSNEYACLYCIQCNSARAQPDVGR